MAIVMFAISVTIFKLFSVKMCITMTFRRGPSSNVNMPTENPNMTCYLMAIVIYTLCHDFQDIYHRNVIDLDLQYWPTSNVNMPIESPYLISYLMTIVIVALSFTISKIFVFGIYMTLTFRMGQGQM